MRNLETRYQMVIRDLSGIILYDSLIRPVHSFTKQFSQLIFNINPFGLSKFSPTTVTNVAGSSVTIFGNMSLRTDASTATSTYGIHVGTSTAAESINDTSLTTQIAHGTSAGQLQYGAVSYAAPSTTATTTTFRVTRVFTNGSGGTITVQEIGLVSQNGSNSFLLIRDLTGAVAVTNGAQLTVNYDFTTTI